MTSMNPLPYAPYYLVPCMPGSLSHNVMSPDSNSGGLQSMRPCHHHLVSVESLVSGVSMELEGIKSPRRTHIQRKIFFYIVESLLQTSFCIGRPLLLSTEVPKIPSPTDQ